MSFIWLPIKLSPNVLGIAEGGEIEAENFDFASRLAKTNFYEINLLKKRIKFVFGGDRSTTVEF